MPKTNLHQQIFIDALPSKVWKVLTSCDYISQYLFDGSVHCQWQEGCDIFLVRQADEKAETIHKGSVLEVVPGVLLKYKLLEEGTRIYNTVTYELIPAEKGIELKFFSEGFSDVAETYFSKAKEIKLILQKIKWLAEYA